MVVLTPHVLNGNFTIVNPIRYGWSPGYLSYACVERYRTLTTKKKDVMSLKLNIMDGPPFRPIISLCSVFSDTTWTMGFTFNDPTLGSHDRRKKSLTVSLLGRFSFGACEGSEASSVYSFVGYAQGGFDGEKDQTAFDCYYYVGVYNVDKRIGHCEKMTEQEFFSCPTARCLFPERANMLKKFAFAKKDGSYEVIRVAIVCENKANVLMFAKFVYENPQTIQTTALHNADIIITDQLRDQIFVNKMNTTPIFLYNERPPKKLPACVLQLKPSSPDNLFILAEKVKIFSKKKSS
jgi:hypothetical protein